MSQSDPLSDDYRADPETVRATADLVDAVPALRPILEEHVAYLDEILPHVVWAPFRHALVDFVERGDDVAVTSFLDVVEGLAASPNDEVRNLIGIIFLEDGVLLSGGREHAALTSLVPRFGPATQALLAETKRHYDALVEASRREP
jgi:hypothetical protein